MSRRAENLSVIDPKPADRLICLLVALGLGLGLYPAGVALSDPAPTPQPSRIVLNPTVHPENSQTVTWRTDADTAAGTAEIRPAAGGPAVTVPATAKGPVSLAGWTYTSRHHTATFTGLTPGTAYRYRVGSEAGWSEWAAFRTATQGAANPWNLLFFGDVQTGLDTVWPQIATQAFTIVPDARAAVFVGDMVDQGSDDDQWNNWFTGLATRTRTTNLIPVVGNHELQGDTSLAQYGSHFTNSGNGPAGTDLYHPNEPRQTISFTDFQGVRIISLDGNDMFPQRQLAFLEKALRNNPNRWTVLAIHEPFISNEPNGASPFFKRDDFMPLLRKYRPDLILQGHNHSYARGYLNSSSTGTIPGAPVFVSAVSGPKRTAASAGPPDDWSTLDATRVRSYQYTGTIQKIEFSRGRILFRSYIAYRGAGSDATGAIGDLADEFTILRSRDGHSLMFEGDQPVPVPVKPIIPSRPRILKVTLNRRKGTARIRVELPSAGTLRMAGKAKRRPLGLLTVSRKAGRARIVTLTVRTRRSFGRGRLPVKLTLSFKSRAAGTVKVNRNITLIRR
ncbi:MAG: metallophosphoesterase family protein [Solirubrobacterales bacterium]|nr:metallophosphoesterase family protein [Solirubrobacterales bacterium]